jgi:hypothetical protein
MEGSEGEMTEKLNVKLAGGRPHGLEVFKESYTSFPFVAKGSEAVSVR